MRDEPGLNSNPNLPCRYVFYNGSGDNGDAVTCSEAIGYGMLIAVLHNSRDDFDALLRYADCFRNNRGLLGWQQRRDPNTRRLVPGENGGENCATDGDLDCVAALWMAGNRWGTTQYTQSACEWGNAILKYCVHPTTKALLIGDWAHPGHMKTGSGSEAVDEQWLTRPSDFIIAHLSLFSKKHTEKNAEWARVMDVTRTIMNNQYKLNPNTGLVADFLVWDSRRKMYMPAKGQVLESSHDGDFNWNSCRVPWRLTHYYLTSQDSSVEPHLQALVKFYETKCRDGTVYAGYKLNGTPFVNYTDLAFLAPAAYCLEAMGSSMADVVRRRVNEAYSDASYFGETIALLTILQASKAAIDLLK
ncbi:Six-hairpin glycosidase-like protein [Syncephalis fuscata]|nr:Six-hairpin glycosidase-like protein [Syncephalis fuscata]